MASLPNLVTEVGPDGMAMEHPVIAYTEKIIEEKELEIKKYIEENYSKIRNVERELASLALEVKLTAGPKKAALEHLRKKIEISGEKIKVARQKEEQAKKIWEAALKALKEEEEKKQRLCEDLNRLVQESAASQYSRLEDLKSKLEALNPETVGQITHGSQTSQRLPNPVDHLSQKERSKPSITAVPEKPSIVSDATRSSKAVTEKESQKGVTKLDDEKLRNHQQGSPRESLNRNNNIVRQGNNTRGRGSILKGNSNQKSQNNNWTGAGFDVDDHTINV